MRSNTCSTQGVWRAVYGRGAGIPLKDRVRVDQPSEPAQEPVSAAGAEHPGRHCWVSVPVDGSSPRPGLLLEWRRAGHLWEGRVVRNSGRLKPSRGLILDWKREGRHWEALVVWHDREGSLKPVVKMDWLRTEDLIPVPVDPNWTGPSR